MPPRRFSDEQEEVLTARYQAGESTRAIARSEGVDKICIIAALRRQGMTQRTPSERNRLYPLNPYRFDVIDAEAAYWWGFIYADGCVQRGKTLSLNVARRDEKQLEKLAFFLDSQSPIKQGIHRANTSTEIDKEYPSSSIEFTDRHLIHRLIELGMIVGREAADNNIFLESIKHLPTKFYRDWIRGLFDGDGSIRYRDAQPYLSFCCSEIVAQWIIKVLREEQLISERIVPKKHNKSNIYYIYIVGRNNVSRLTHYLYDGATTYMERKYEIAARSFIVPTPRERNEKGQYR